MQGEQSRLMNYDGNPYNSGWFQRLMQPRRAGPPPPPPPPPRRPLRATHRASVTIALYTTSIRQELHPVRIVHALRLALHHCNSRMTRSQRHSATSHSVTAELEPRCRSAELNESLRLWRRFSSRQALVLQYEPVNLWANCEESRRRRRYAKAARSSLLCK